MEKGYRVPQGVVSEPFPTTLSAVWIFLLRHCEAHVYIHALGACSRAGREGKCL